MTSIKSFIWRFSLIACTLEKLRLCVWERICLKKKNSKWKHVVHNPPPGLDVIYERRKKKNPWESYKESLPGEHLNFQKYNKWKGHPKVGWLRLIMSPSQISRCCGGKKQHEILWTSVQIGYCKWILKLSLVIFTSPKNTLLSI